MEFLYVPGDEASGGIVHQLQLTRLIGQRKIYWVVHYRSEQPVSRFIQELKAKGAAEDKVTEIVTHLGVMDTMTTKPKQEWARSQALTEPAKTVAEALTTLSGPCILGVQNLDGGKIVAPK